jgi:hypothetical protein
VTFAASGLPRLVGEAKADEKSVFELRQYTLYGGQRYFRSNANEPHSSRVLFQ